MSKVVNVGIWGLGRAGYGMIRSELLPLPNFKIVAGCDLIAARAKKLATDVKAKAYTKSKAFLADPAIDMVVVATRSCNHVQCAIEALKAGKDVLVEKPMATSLDDVDRLYAVAKETGSKLVVRHNRRFDPHLLLAKEVVASGVLGEVFSVQIRTGGYNRRNDWQTIKKFGGGQIFNWGPHCIDWALQFIGGWAVEIKAELKKIAAAGDAEDWVKIIMRGPTGGVADIEISGASVFTQPLLMVQGTRGGISLDWKHYKLKHLAKKLPAVKANPDTPADGMSFGNPEKLEWVEKEGPITPKDTSTFWGAVYDTLALDKPFPVTPMAAREVIRVIDVASRLSPL